MDEAICRILSRAALCFSHRRTEPKGLPPQQQPALNARTLSIRRRSLPVCCCDSDTANNQSRDQFSMSNITFGKVYPLNQTIFDEFTSKQINEILLPSRATSSSILKSTL